MRLGRKRDDTAGFLLESIGSNLGSIDSGLLFRLILSRCRIRVCDGGKKFVLFLSKIDFDEVLFIPIPEEIVEFLDKVQGFPSDLNSLLIFHLFLPLELPVWIPSCLVSPGADPARGIKLCDWFLPWYWRMPVEKGH